MQALVPVSVVEHIRKRPGMYIGNLGEKGFAGLIENVLVEFTEVYGTDNFLCSLELHPQYLKLELHGHLNAALALKALSCDFTEGYLYIKALMALSTKFEAQLVTPC